jgi:hypothetical protein
MEVINPERQDLDAFGLDESAKEKADPEGPA